MLSSAKVTSYAMLIAVKTVLFFVYVFCIFASYLKGHFHAFVWLNKPFLHHHKTLFESSKRMYSLFFDINVVRKEIEDFYRALQWWQWKSQKSLAKCHFWKLGIFGKTAVTGVEQRGFYQVCVCVCVCVLFRLLYLYSRLWSDAAAAGVVCRNPMSILRRQWDMPKFLPFALLLEF